MTTPKVNGASRLRKSSSWEGFSVWLWQGVHRDVTGQKFVRIRQRMDTVRWVGSPPKPFRVWHAFAPIPSITCRRVTNGKSRWSEDSLCGPRRVAQDQSLILVCGL